MVAKYAKHVSRRATPQSEPMPGRETEQVKNSAGGYVFEIDDWARLDRFLILGAEGGTYYVTEKALTVDNAKVVQRCIAADGPRTVARIVEISDAGRAPKNDPALFALALCASAHQAATRKAALDALPKVARIGTHLFHFADYVNAQRGWGRQLRRAVANWYDKKPLEALAGQVAKYQSRDGWSNRDMLRLSHPVTGDPVRKAIYDWVCGRPANEFLPEYLRAVDALKAETSAKDVAKAITKYRLPRECVPTEMLNEYDVWAALLADMPLTAMIRNLGKMTAIELLKPMSKYSAHVVKALCADVVALRRARVHPLQILLAAKIYGQGHGEKGSLSWRPVSEVIDALETAFENSFEAIEPTGKRIMLALDVSGSMSSPFMNSPLRVCEATAAMAMVVKRTEKQSYVTGFSTGLVDLGITAKTSIGDAAKKANLHNWGGTDCSMPMLHALKHEWEVDAFVVMTDNETWAGRTHPAQALASYRAKTGIPAKLVVVGMTSTGFTIADPKDPGMLDVVGFDTATPAAIADFIR